MKSPSINAQNSPNVRAGSSPNIRSPNIISVQGVSPKIITVQNSPPNLKSPSINVQSPSPQMKSPAINVQNSTSNLKSPIMQGASNTRVSSTYSSPGISPKISPRQSAQISPVSPGIVIPPRMKTPQLKAESEPQIKIPPRSQAPAPVANDYPVIPTRTVTVNNNNNNDGNNDGNTPTNNIPVTSNLNALDFIIASSDLDDRSIEHRIKKIQTKLEIEKKYKIGSEKAIEVITMCGTPKNSSQYNEAQMRLKESNEKIDCLNKAKQKYEKLYKGQPIEKDMTGEYIFNFYFIYLLLFVFICFYFILFFQFMFIIYLIIFYFNIIYIVFLT